MSRNAKIVAAIAVVVVMAAVATVLSMKFFMSTPDDLDLARSKPSANGVYQVSIEPVLEPVEQGALHAWIVTVSSPDGKPVTDATLTLDGGMPQHGHGLPTRPQSAGPIGEGRYRIEGVRFNMSGWWMLKVGIDASAGKDEADFNIVL
jgi:hypothetical protein